MKSVFSAKPWQDGWLATITFLFRTRATCAPAAHDMVGPGLHNDNDWHGLGAISDLIEAGHSDQKPPQQPADQVGLSGTKVIIHVEACFQDDDDCEFSSDDLDAAKPDHGA